MSRASLSSKELIRRQGRGDLAAYHSYVSSSLLDSKLVHWTGKNYLC